MEYQACMSAQSDLVLGAHSIYSTQRQLNEKYNLLLLYSVYSIATGTHQQRSEPSAKKTILGFTSSSHPPISKNGENIVGGVRRSDVQRGTRPAGFRRKVSIFSEIFNQANISRSGSYHHFVGDLYLDGWQFE